MSFRQRGQYGLVMCEKEMALCISNILFFNCLYVGFEIRNCIFIVLEQHTIDITSNKIIIKNISNETKLRLKSQEYFIITFRIIFYLKITIKSHDVQAYA